MIELCGVIVDVFFPRRHSCKHFLYSPHRSCQRRRLAGGNSWTMHAVWDHKHLVLSSLSRQRRRGASSACVSEQTQQSSQRSALDAVARLSHGQAMQAWRDCQSEFEELLSHGANCSVAKTSRQPSINSHNIAVSTVL